MKKNIRAQMITSLSKLNNLSEACKEIEEKITRLQEQISNLQKAAEKEEKHIALLGLKQESRDAEHPDSAETLAEKNKYNSVLQSEKAALIEQASEEKYSNLQGSLSRFQQLLKQAEGNQRF